MNKTQLVEKIKNFDPSTLSLEDYGSTRYGDPAFLGKYALPAYLLCDETGLEWENLKEDFKRLKLKHYEDFAAETYSSKSGTGFTLVKPNFDYDELVYGVEDALEVLRNAESENGVSHEDLKKCWREIEIAQKEFVRLKAEIEAEVEKAKAWVKSFALGVRTSVFSNGEVVFTPIKGNAAGYTELFTPYYNPNEREEAQV